MAEEVLSNADFIIQKIMPNIKEKFGVDIEEFINNPRSFSEDNDIINKVEQIEAEVDDEITKIIAGMGDAQKDFDDSISKATAISNTLAQSISVEAKQHNTPILAPTDMENMQDNIPTIYVDNAEDNTINFAKKLAGISNFILLSNITYKENKIIGWTFVTNHGSYALRIEIPESIVLDFEYARNEIINGIEAARAYLS